VYYFTYLLLNLCLIKEQQQDLLQTIRLIISEMGDAIGVRQQLSTTSFQAVELEIAVNYPVHTLMGNGSFTQNLGSCSMPFWLVILTEHEVLHC